MKKPKEVTIEFHLDGANYGSDSESDKVSSEPESSENDEINDDDDDDDDDADSPTPSTSSSIVGQEERDLCSDDDISDDDAKEAFNCKNQMLCQFELVKRKQQKWSIKLKDGIMNVKGRDYSFSKCTGEADW